MLLDTVEGLRLFHARIVAFIESSHGEGVFPAETSGSPEPYSEFLGGLRVKKEAEEPRLVLSHDRWLVLSGSQEALVRFSRELKVEQDGEHHHWYSSPVSLVIEADESWSSSQNES